MWRVGGCWIGVCEGGLLGGLEGRERSSQCCRMVMGGSGAMCGRGGCVGGGSGLGRG